MKSLSRSYLKNPGSKSNACVRASLGIVAFFLVATAARAEWHSDARPRMGTEVSVYFLHEDEAEGRAVINLRNPVAGAIPFDRLLTADPAHADAARAAGREAEGCSWRRNTECNPDGSRIAPVPGGGCR